MRRLFVLVCSLLCLGVTAASAEEASKTTESTPAHPIAYPAGYRNWKHVKSMVIFDKNHPLYDAFAGIHHIYANDLALKALKAHSDNYPKGSVFVFDLLEADNQSGAYVEGKRKFVAAIVRDAKKFADTEGWGWQVWAGGDKDKPQLKTVAEQKACATCHLEVAKKGFVFTEYRP
jgi:hypothetical protein